MKLHGRSSKAQRERRMPADVYDAGYCEEVDVRVLNILSALKSAFEIVRSSDLSTGN